MRLPDALTSLHGVVVGGLDREIEPFAWDDINSRGVITALMLGPRPHCSE